MSEPKRAAGFDIPEPEPTDGGNSAAPIDAPPVTSIPSAFHADTPKNTGTCRYCGAQFTKRTTWQKYCCEAHRIQQAANDKGRTVRGIAPEITIA